MSVQIQCQSCKKIVNGPDNWDKQAICTTCGSYFQEINQNPYLNMQNQFKDIGNRFSSAMPHVYIGSGGVTSKKPNQPLYFPYQTKQEKTYAKIREVALYVCIALVAGYAAFRVFF